MKVGRIEQLTTHVNRELGSIAAGVESWQRAAITERDQRVAELEAQVAGLTADRERLDRLEGWMRDDGATVRHSLDGFHIFYRGAALACNQPSLRAAIEAARKAAK